MFTEFEIDITVSQKGRLIAKLVSMGLNPQFGILPKVDGVLLGYEMYEKHILITIISKPRYLDIAIAKRKIYTLIGQG